ncbi:MAG TPA: type IV pilin protein [Rubrivivax sp.]|nr:type IV pilin protein [Rubrivivax sp.]
MNSTRPRPCRSHAGFTLVECATACAVAGLLAASALPSLQGHQLRAARIDAVAALTRVQAEQEKHRELHGLYASDLAVLRGVAPTSAQGRYTLALEKTGADTYRATATAAGVQVKDQACPALTLEVNSGFPRHGPSAACWNR